MAQNSAKLGCLIVLICKPVSGNGNLRLSLECQTFSNFDFQRLVHNSRQSLGINAEIRMEPTQNQLFPQKIDILTSNPICFKISAWSLKKWSGSGQLQQLIKPVGGWSNDGDQIQTDCDLTMSVKQRSLLCILCVKPHAENRRPKKEVEN